MTVPRVKCDLWAISSELNALLTRVALTNSTKIRKQLFSLSLSENNPSDSENHCSSLFTFDSCGFRNLTIVIRFILYSFVRKFIRIMLETIRFICFSRHEIGDGKYL